jgi:hypothetical protein
MLLHSGCYAQEKSQMIKDTAILENHSESIWIPASFDEDNKNSKIKDTTLKVLYLIFERQFDDSIKILFDNKEIYSKRIKTIKNLSVVDDEFSINYTKAETGFIEIILINKNRKISFNPKQGFALCYLSRLGNLWNLDFSNYQRSYY